MNACVIGNMRLQQLSGHLSVNERALPLNFRLEHELERFCGEVSLPLVGIQASIRLLHELECHSVNLVRAWYSSTFIVAASERIC